MVDSFLISALNKRNSYISLALSSLMLLMKNVVPEVESASDIR